MSSISFFNYLWYEYEKNYSIYVLLLEITWNMDHYLTYLYCNEYVVFCVDDDMKWLVVNGTCILANILGTAMHDDWQTLLSINKIMIHYNVSYNTYMYVGVCKRVVFVISTVGLVVLLIHSVGLTSHIYSCKNGHFTSIVMDTKVR